MQEQKISIETIETKEFHVAARGYNQHEVDEFLDSICDELERMENELTALKAENDRLKHQALPQERGEAPAAPKAAPATTPEGTFREILEMALRVKEETIADAQAKAAKIVEEAEVQAQARMGNLTEEKEALEAQVAAMKETAQNYKAQLADVLSLAKEALDAAGEL